MMPNWATRMAKTSKTFHGQLGNYLPTKFTWSPV